MHSNQNISLHGISFKMARKVTHYYHTFDKKNKKKFNNKKPIHF